MTTNKANIDIRTSINSAGIKYWQVADKLGMADGNFSRKLRKELSAEEKAKIKKIIKQLSKQEVV